MKEMLMKIKKNLQGMNSRMDEAKNQGNDMEHKGKKQPIRTIRRKKKKPKKQG